MKKSLVFILAAVLFVGCNNEPTSYQVEMKDFKNQVVTANMFRMDFKSNEGKDYSDKIKIEINRSYDSAAYLVDYKLIKTYYYDYQLLITNLAPGHDYRFRMYINEDGINSKSDWVEFTTLSDELNFNPNLEYGSVTDIEGNEYRTITIDSMEWMAENLRVTKFNDGTELQRFMNHESSSQQAAAYCFYNDNEGLYGNAYAALYSGSVIDTAINLGKNICPQAWHIPSVDEWNKLINKYNPIEKKTLAEKGFRHWIDADTTYKHDCGFNSIPGGTFKASYEGLGTDAYYMSSELNENYRLTVFHHHNAGYHFMQEYTIKVQFVSIRCVKD